MNHAFTIEILNKLWRITLTVVVAQILFFILGSIWTVSHDSFTNSWIGAAMATPVAFALGFVWHVSDKDRRKITPWGSVFLLGIISVFLGFMSVFERSTAIVQTANIESLRQLSEDDIEQIHVYDQYGGTLLTSITNKEAIIEFRNLCSDISGFSYNHDKSTFHCCLILEGSQTRELSFSFIERRPNSAIGTYLKRDGNTSYNLGIFESRNLRSWFEKNILKKANQSSELTRYNAQF